MNEFRILRSVKNRYGSTSELGIFEMTDKGLREISNPSEILISQRDEDVSGVAVAAAGGGACVGVGVGVEGRRHACGDEDLPDDDVLVLQIRLDAPRGRDR